ncbi:MAG: hypothetical protein ACI9G1_000839 [Pirellulaceae bacterium]|jgi:hypothetical protein
MGKTMMGKTMMGKTMMGKTMKAVGYIVIWSLLGMRLGRRLRMQHERCSLQDQGECQFVGPESGRLRRVFSLACVD